MVMTLEGGKLVNAQPVIRDPNPPINKKDNNDYKFPVRRLRVHLDHFKLVIRYGPGFPIFAL